VTDSFYLHIGEPKSGTTYIQGVLQHNREKLHQAGLVMPDPRMQIRAAQGAIRGGADEELWAQMVGGLINSGASSALVSMETLCRANPKAIRRALKAISGPQVKVIVTVRDIARSLPAQWQQSTQHRKTWSWQEYSDAVVSGDDKNPASRNFWSQHDLPRILHDWSAVVTPSQVTVVTLPQRGAPPATLWERFAATIGVSGDKYETVDPANESLGAASAELLRRLNLALPPDDFNERQYNTLVRRVIARQGLAQRRSQESAVALHTKAAPWAQREASRIIAAIGSSGVEVVGDVNELVPVATSLSDEETDFDETAVGAAAVDALRALLLHRG